MDYFRHDTLFHAALNKHKFRWENNVVPSPVYPPSAYGVESVEQGRGLATAVVRWKTLQSILKEKYTLQESRLPDNTSLPDHILPCSHKLFQAALNKPKHTRRRGKKCPLPTEAYEFANFQCFGNQSEPQNSNNLSPAGALMWSIV